MRGLRWNFVGRAIGIHGIAAVVTVATAASGLAQQFDAPYYELEKSMALHGQQKTRPSMPSLMSSKPSSAIVPTSSTS